MLGIIKRIDKPLLILSIILFAIGLLTIYSASNVTAYMLNEADPSRYFMKESLFLISGIVMCLIFIMIPTKSYGPWSWIISFIIAVVIVILALMGQVINGMSGWINYNGFGIQPSEFAKIAIIPLIATYYGRKCRDYSDDLKVMAIPMIAAALVACTIIFQGDLGTALIFIGLVALMFFFSPVSKRLKTYAAILGLVGVVLVGILVGTGGAGIIPKEKLARFNLNDPCERYITTGNQLCNGYIAINSGGFTGKGLGNSTQKYLYLPEAHTDFIYAIFVEETGILGGILLIVLYFMLIVRIIVIGKSSRLLYKKMICYGVAFYIFMHIIVNLTGVLGILPMTGVPLPFMSYGGSICWSLLVALTMVFRISYENKMQKN